MGVNKYFQNDKITNVNPTVGLYESLIAEAIQINGENCYFIPRESMNDAGADLLFGEDTASKFDRAYKMEMYINSSMGYSGDKDFFSKFGLEMRNDFTLVVAMRKFEQYVPSTVRTRPQEGDLIFVPQVKKFFEIKFVDPDTDFYQIGNRRRYTYELRCEQFRYSHENVDTGVAEIDDLIPDNDYSVLLTLITGSSNTNFIFGESVSSNGGATAIVQNWVSANGMLVVTRPVGQFVASQVVTGADSNAIYQISNVDDRANLLAYDYSDNKDIQTEANTIIDTSEINPFGAP